MLPADCCVVRVVVADVGVVCYVTVVIADGVNIAVGHAGARIGKGSVVDDAVNDVGGVGSVVIGGNAGADVVVAVTGVCCYCRCWCY